MAYIFNPITFRTGYSMKWMDLWYVENRYYPYFLHISLKIRSLIYYIVTQIVVEKGGLYFSHLKLRIIKDKFLILVFFYDALRFEFYKFRWHAKKFIRQYYWNKWSITPGRKTRRRFWIRHYRWLRGKYKRLRYSFEAERLFMFMFFLGLGAENLFFEEPSLIRGFKDKSGRYHSRRRDRYIREYKRMYYSHTEMKLFKVIFTWICQDPTYSWVLKKESIIYRKLRFLAFFMSSAKFATVRFAAERSRLLKWCLVGFRFRKIRYKVWPDSDVKDVIYHPKTIWVLKTMLNRYLRKFNIFLNLVVEKHKTKELLPRYKSQIKKSLKVYFFSKTKNKTLVYSDLKNNNNEFNSIMWERYGRRILKLMKRILKMYVHVRLSRQFGYRHGILKKESNVAFLMKKDNNRFDVIGTRNINVTDRYVQQTLLWYNNTVNYRLPFKFSFNNKNFKGRKYIGILGNVKVLGSPMVKFFYKFKSCLKRKKKGMVFPKKKYIFPLSPWLKRSYKKYLKKRTYESIVLDAKQLDRPASTWELQHELRFLKNYKWRWQQRYRSGMYVRHSYTRIAFVIGLIRLFLERSYTIDGLVGKYSSWYGLVNIGKSLFSINARQPFLKSLSALLCFGVKVISGFNSKFIFYMLSNDEVTAAFVARHIASRLTLDFKWRDFIGPLKRDLRRQMRQKVYRKSIYTDNFEKGLLKEFFEDLKLYIYYLRDRQLDIFKIYYFMSGLIFREAEGTRSVVRYKAHKSVYGDRNYFLFWIATIGASISGRVLEYCTFPLMVYEVKDVIKVSFVYLVKRAFMVWVSFLFVFCWSGGGWFKVYRKVFFKLFRSFFFIKRIKYKRKNTKRFYLRFHHWYSAEDISARHVLNADISEFVFNLVHSAVVETRSKPTLYHWGKAENIWRSIGQAAKGFDMEGAAASLSDAYLKLRRYAKFNRLHGFRIRFVGRLRRKSRRSNVWLKMGSVATSTMNAKIEYGICTVPLTYSVFSVRVWLYRNDVRSKYVHKLRV